MILDAQSADALTEMVQVGVGFSAGLLQSILDAPVELRNPQIEWIQAYDLPNGFDPLTSVELGFSGLLLGDAKMLFPRETALYLAALLNEAAPDSPDLDSLCGPTLTELGNLVLNGIVGTISNRLDLQLHYEVPRYAETPQQEWLAARSSERTLLVRSRLAVKDHPVEGEFWFCLDLASARLMAESLKN